MDNKTEELLQLVKDNPGIPVRFMVNYEVCASDECTWWMATISLVKKTYYWRDDERVYIDEDVIMDELEVRYDNNGDSREDINEDEVRKDLEKQYADMIATKKIEEAIIVYVDV